MSPIDDRKITVGADAGLPIDPRANRPAVVRYLPEICGQRNCCARQNCIQRSNSDNLRSARSRCSETVRIGNQKEISAPGRNSQIYGRFAASNCRVRCMARPLTRPAPHALDTSAAKDTKPIRASVDQCRCNQSPACRRADSMLRIWGAETSRPSVRNPLIMLGRYGLSNQCGHTAKRTPAMCVGYTKRAPRHSTGNCKY